MASKFKVGDRVKIISNPVTPSSVGKIAEITSVLDSDNVSDGIALYKVALIGQVSPLRAWAEEDCLAFADEN